MDPGPCKIQPQRLRAHALPAVPLLAALFLALTVLPFRAQAQSIGVLTGRVTATQGQPQAVLVHVFADGDLPARDVYTDSNGYYVVTGLPNGTYAVVVEAEGYKPFRQTTRLDNIIMPRGSGDGGA